MKGLRGRQFRLMLIWLAQAGVNLGLGSLGPVHDGWWTEDEAESDVATYKGFLCIDFLVILGSREFPSRRRPAFALLAISNFEGNRRQLTNRYFLKTSTISFQINFLLGAGKFELHF
jgi:hypothetical protein